MASYADARAAGGRWLLRSHGRAAGGDGKLDRERFVLWMAPVRQQVEAALQRAVAAGLEDVSGSCADILVHAQALWTSVESPGVEPTNNHAERELRAFVLWRKRSFGTQSERGNLFANA